MENYYTHLTQFAAAEYSCGTYGAGSYNDNGVCATTGTNSGTAGNNSSLLATGEAVALPLVVGLVLIVAPIVALVVKHKKQATSNS